MNDRSTRDQRASGQDGDADSVSISAADTLCTTIALLAHDLSRIALALDSRAWAAAALATLDAAILVHRAASGEAVSQ
jgi:hypothetical protein